MAALLWVTDPHLDHVRARGGVEAFGKYLAAEHPEIDTLLVTGDISESPTVVRHLKELAVGFGKKIAFILGNHDLYRGSIRGTHRKVAAMKVPNLVWLDRAAPIVFDDFALVGQYSWYDGLNGKPQSTQVVLYDFESVAEFSKLFNEFEWVYWADRGSRNPLLKLFRKLAGEAVANVRPKLEQALQLRRHVILATHVAPFEGAAWHEGKPSNPDWQPWFSCRQMGDMLAEVAALHPDHKILVLCGHSHSPGEYQHAPNLRVLTGKAEYGYPDLAGVLEKPFEGW